MKKNGHITGFYLETLLLIVVFIAIILVLTQVFGLAQVQSVRAKQLTEAVTLAGNTAEAVSASRSPEDLLALLNENENAALLPGSAGVTASYGSDLSPDPAGNYRVEASWLPEQMDTGRMVHSVILVRFGADEEPVYELETAVFLPGVES